MAARIYGSAAQILRQAGQFIVEVLRETQCKADGVSDTLRALPSSMTQMALGGEGAISLDQSVARALCPGEGHLRKGARGL